MAHSHDHADGHGHGDHGHDHAHAHAHRDVGTTHGHDGHGHAPVEKAAPSVVVPPSIVAAKEKKQARRLAIVLGLIAAFFFVELFGAKAARSDVLEADAYHLLMDVFAIAVSLLAMRVASARPSDRFTFGLRRAEPIAALLNALLVFGVAVEIVRDSLEHLASPTTPRSSLMLVIATAALCVNGLSAWLLHGAMHGHGGHDHGHAHAGHAAHAHDDDDGHHPHAHHLNMRGAWLHLLGDALGSVAAFSAGLAMKLGAPSFVDPLASFAVVAILVIGAVRLFRDAVLVLLEAAPPRLAVDRVRKVILEHPGVSRVHALHVWSLGTGHDAITAHVHASAPDAGLGMRVAERLRARFAVEYVTVQVDPDRDGAAVAPGG
jgi:cation diffusion facilitator family transporter